MADSSIRVIIEAVDRLTGPLRDMGRQVGSATANVGRRLGAVGSEVGKLGAKLGVVGGLIGFGFKKIFIDTASQFEQFNAILETTERSSEGARKAMDWVSDFAAKTPFELDEVMDSFVRLRSIGLDPTTGLLKTLGNTGAAMGKPIMQAVEAIGDAVTGENERLKEFGITASVKKGETTFTFTDSAGKQQSRTVDNRNRKIIQSTLEAIWNEKYAGAMEKQSNTWLGMMSNISDQWTRFVNMVMGAGVFDFLKDKLKIVLDKINALAESGELKEMADAFGATLLEGLERAWELGKDFLKVMEDLPEQINAVAEAVGGYKVLAGALAVVIAGPLIASIVALGSALVTLTGVLIANPLLAIVAAIALGAFLIIKHWEPIKEFFAELWDDIIGIFDSAMERIKGFFDEPTLKGIIGFFVEEPEAAPGGQSEESSAAPVRKKPSALAEAAVGIAGAGAAAAIIGTLITAAPLAQRAISGLSTVLTTLGRTVLPIVAGGLRALMAVLIANPIGAIIAVIAGAALLIFTYWDEVGPWFKDIWAEVAEIFDLAVISIDAALTEGMSSMVESIESVWTGVKDFFVDLWDGILGIFSSALSQISGFLNNPILRKASGLVSQGLGAIGSLTGLTGSGAAEAAAPSAPKLVASGAPRPSAVSKNETEVGGKIVVEINNRGRGRVADVSSTNRAVPLRVNTGLVMAEAGA